MRIFDVPIYIENNIKRGFKNPYTWVSDAGLYVRWQHAIRPELKRKDVKELLIKKCKKTVPGYNHDIQYKTINQILDKNWNKEFFPTKIKMITISESVVHWFNAQKLKKNELKFLFALYILYIVKKTYKNEESCKYIFDNGEDKEFLRNNSSLPKNISTFKMFCRMNELGYINMFCECATLLFVDIPELKVVTTVRDDRPSEYIFYFECGDFSAQNQKYIFVTEDLYDFGNKFLNLNYNIYTCCNCGKIIEKKVHNQKYCKECAKALRKTSEKIQKQCSKCGKFFIATKNSKRTICEECYNKKRKEKINENAKKYYKNNK